MKHYTLVIIIVATFFIGFLFLSCSASKREWEGDYSSYNAGAYINGVECHPIAAIGKTFNGIDVYYRDTLIKIEAHHIRGGLSSKSLPKWSNAPVYRFHFLIITDTLSFKYGVQYSIEGYTGESIDDYVWKFVEGSYDGHHLVMATVYDYTNGVLFKAKEGGICVFRENKIAFDFIAESKDGERLVVSDGYIWGSMLTSNNEE